jgi:hypothetical protein
VVPLTALLLCQGAIAETTQEGSLRVAFGGKVRPQKLPRTEKAPISVSLSGDIKTTDESTPPQLRKIVLQINRQGAIDTRGLPSCRIDQIQPATSEEALSNCAPSLVGEGRFRAAVALPDQSPFPSNGKVLAFNGKIDGKLAVLAHIYGREPLPTSYVLPFVLKRRARGPYAATFTAELPRIAAEWGYVSGISLTLRRRFHAAGRTRSYLSAGCPAPKGFASGHFSFARASFAFEDGRTLSSILTRRCRAG